MRRKVLVLVVLVIAGTIGACIPQALHRVVLLAQTVNAPGGPLRAVARLRQIEKLGRVPDGADVWDWWLAQETSWWGKRLDPKAFWKDRVVWLDTSASMAAQRWGRSYPPPPYSVPGLISRSDVDMTTLPTADSPDILYRFSDREMAFWHGFTETHPRPPEMIAALQLELADRVLGTHYDFEHGNTVAGRTQANLECMDRWLRAQTQEMGCPREATTDEALQWALVLKARRDYEQQYVQTHREKTLLTTNFLARLIVKPDLVTQPLSREQMKAANAWKITYLRRLCDEHTDECYINAYLSAWKLSAAEVFETRSGQ